MADGYEPLSRQLYNILPCSDRSRRKAFGRGAPLHRSILLYIFHKSTHTLTLVHALAANSDGPKERRLEYNQMPLPAANNPAPCHAEIQRDTALHAGGSDGASASSVDGAEQGKLDGAANFDRHEPRANPQMARQITRMRPLFASAVDLGAGVGAADVGVEV